MASVTMNGGAPLRWDWTLRDSSNRVLRRLSFQGNVWRWEEDYIHASGKLIAAAVPTPEKILHFHTDHLGTPRLITGNGGARVSEHNYFPFGREVPTTAQQSSAIPPFSESKKFTGHERDAATLDYMHARYYATYLGRFLSVDPYLDIEKTKHNPQMWNRYAYVTNNPLRYTDPTGRSLWSTLGKGAYYVLAYSKRHGEKLVATILPGKKKDVMKAIREGVDSARPQGSKIAVVTPTTKTRDGIASELSTNGAARGPERSGTDWPTHLNPQQGPYKDVHVQTLSDTKKKGLGGELLGLVAGTTLAATANADATPGEIVSAALWDTAKAIDPIFLTDAIEYATGVDEYTQSPPDQ